MVVESVDDNPTVETTDSKSPLESPTSLASSPLHEEIGGVISTKLWPSRVFTEGVENLSSEKSTVTRKLV